MKQKKKSNSDPYKRTMPEVTEEEAEREALIKPTDPIKELQEQNKELVVALKEAASAFNKQQEQIKELKKNQLQMLQAVDQANAKPQPLPTDPTPQQPQNNEATSALLQMVSNLTAPEQKSELETMFTAVGQDVFTSFVKSFTRKRFIKDAKKDTGQKYRHKKRDEE